VAFDKAGYLYVGNGDGGSAGDPHGNGQNLDTFLGKMLRLDVDSASPYAIPKDNPFAAGGGRKEIFAWGLRNPWRFSFDRKTGALFAADVGQDRREEIDLIEKGKNYGWNVMEGNLCFLPSENCKRTGLVMPLYDYGRTDGICVTGGFVYRGKKIPWLEGVYVYGDFGTGRIWGLTYDQEKRQVVKNELLLETRLSISSFGEQHDGEILVFDLGGQIKRIAPVRESH